MSHSHSEDELDKQYLFVLRYRKASSVSELIEFYPVSLIYKKLSILKNHWNFEDDRELILKYLEELETLYPKDNYPEYYL